MACRDNFRFVVGPGREHTHVRFSDHSVLRREVDGLLLHADILRVKEDSVRDGLNFRG